VTQRSPASPGIRIRGPDRSRSSGSSRPCRPSPRRGRCRARDRIRCPWQQRKSSPGGEGSMEKAFCIACAPDSGARLRPVVGRALPIRNGLNLSFQVLLELLIEVLSADLK
jgi:hypothetical protein